MRPLTLAVGIFALLASASACNKKKSGFPATEAGAKTMLAQFLKKDADLVKLSMALKPQSGDYAKVFADAAMAKKAEETYKQLWDSVGKRPLGPKEGQTEILIWEASTDDLKEQKGNAKHFPGGYKRAAKHLKSGLKLYRFKFVKPGKTLGMAFDGLYNLDGRWVLMPKPWRITK